MTGAPPPARPPWRRARTAGFAALAAGLGYVVAAVACFVLPHSDPLPAHADVAVVLGPPTLERQALAMRLLRTGRVDAVLVSLGGSVYPDPAEAAARRLCATEPAVRCAQPVPRTTQGEARLLRAGAEAEGWRSAVVITHNAHLLRARTIVARCFSGPLTMRASGESEPHPWPYEIAYQTGASLKAWFVTPTC